MQKSADKKIMQHFGDQNDLKYRLFSSDGCGGCTEKIYFSGRNQFGTKPRITI